MRRNLLSYSLICCEGDKWKQQMSNNILKELDMTLYCSIKLSVRHTTISGRRNKMCSIRQMALRLCVPRLKIVYQVINTHNSVDRYSNIFCLDSTHFFYYLPLSKKKPGVVLNKHLSAI